MKRLILLAFIALTFPARVAAQPQTYKPTWESIDQRPIPAWFDDAKFGIFIHWGVYSVPAFADPRAQGGQAYAEWYWNHMQDKNGPTWKFHLLHYGETFKYQDFAGQFKAEVFDPDAWAGLFARSGARYVVLTSKHHEGFCLWPCPASWNWNSVDVGPHRDLAGDLATAVVAHGLKMGFYYSLYEWYDPLYLSDRERYVTEHMLPQMKDLVVRYRPSLLWTDGEWDHPSEVWHSTEFLAWLFNESPVRDEIVIDDRWGKETRSVHGGFYTSEYGRAHGRTFETPTRHKWEETQGMGKSFGYNRMETVGDYRSASELIRLLVRAVSEGGNLLLDIGPTADGRIPVIMQERLLQMGAWLKLNAEAIYGTHPWRELSEGNVHYTQKGNAVYAIAEGWPGRELELNAPKTTAGTTVTLLGGEGLPTEASAKAGKPAVAGRLQWHVAGGKLRIDVPPIPAALLDLPQVYVFKVVGVE